MDKTMVAPPWRMNFKLNECQHSNCFKTKVQLNKCEIHMDMTFTFHSPEGAWQRND